MPVRRLIVATLAVLITAASACTPALAVGSVTVTASSASPLRGQVVFTAVPHGIAADAVEFRIGSWSSPPVATDTTAPYELRLDTAVLPNGTYSLLVKARSSVAYAVGTLSFSTANDAQRYRAEAFPVDVHAGLEYARAVDEHGREEVLRLDLYVPRGDTAAGRPAIVWIHGGGFTGGNRHDPGIVELARRFAARGYVTASISYRLHEAGGFDLWSPADALARRVLDDAQADALAAVRWFGAAAPILRVDPSKVVLGGRSAGAVTALRAATRADEGGPAVAAAVSISGTSDPRFAGPGDPPALLLHGTADPIVPIASARALCDALPACELVPFEGGTHYLDAHRERVVAHASAFLADRLGL